VEEQLKKLASQYKIKLTKDLKQDLLFWALDHEKSQESPENPTFNA